MKLTDVIALNEYTDKPFIDEDTVKLLEMGKIKPEEVAQEQLKSLLFGKQPIAGIVRERVRELSFFYLVSG